MPICQTSLKTSTFTLGLHLNTEQFSVQYNLFDQDKNTSKLCEKGGERRDCKQVCKLRYHAITRSNIFATEFKGNLLSYYKDICFAII